jgi:hypothetical protein
MDQNLEGSKTCKWSVIHRSLDRIGLNAKSAEAAKGDHSYKTSSRAELLRALEALPSIPIPKICNDIEQGDIRRMCC